MFKKRFSVQLLFIDYLIKQTTDLHFYMDLKFQRNNLCKNMERIFTKNQKMENQNIDDWKFRLKNCLKMEGSYFERDKINLDK